MTKKIGVEKDKGLFTVKSIEMLFTFFQSPLFTYLHAICGVKWSRVIEQYP